MLKTYLWTSKNICITTKLRILNSNIKSSCCMERRPKGLRKHPCRGSRPSMNPVSGASSKSDGLKGSQMKICGRKHDKNHWRCKKDVGSGTGLDTPCGNHHPALHVKPLSSTHWDRGKGIAQGVVQETPGGGMQRQSFRH